MRFKLGLLMALAPALALAACGDAGGAEVSEGATEGTAKASEEDTADTATTSDSATSAKAESEPEKAATQSKSASAKSGTWTCEDQGDVEVVFRKADDGTATLTYTVAGDMGIGQQPTVVSLEATGASAGYDDRSGRMAADDGSAIVWFMNDGRVEVTEGEGADRSSYFCSRAG